MKIYEVVAYDRCGEYSSRRCTGRVEAVIGLYEYRLLYPACAIRVYCPYECDLGRDDGLTEDERDLFAEVP